MPPVVVAALTLLGAPPAAAHDFWIEPSTYRPAPGATVDVTLKIGHRDEIVTYPRDPRHVRRFVLTRPATAIAVEGRAGDDPAGRVRVPGPGSWWLGYRSHRTRTTIASEKFERYLESEGLGAVITDRAARGEGAAPGSEAFSRCAKALLAAPGAGEPTDVGAPLGFTLELVPATDLAALRPGDAATHTLLFRGAPRDGVLVEARRLDATARTLSQVTDAQGRVTFRFPSAGVWLLAAVYMERAEPGVDADWESWWASLTFDLAPPG